MYRKIRQHMRDLFIRLGHSQGDPHREHVHPYPHDDTHVHSHFSHHRHYNSSDNDGYAHGEEVSDLHTLH